MDPVWLLALLPLAAGSGWLAATFARRRGPAAGKRQLPTAYYRGLNLLLNEQHDKAIEILVKALEEDTETVEVQLALGNLFRRRGEIARATRIHQNLIARDNLDDSQRTQALFELGQDYFKAGLLDRAEDLFRELTEISEHSEQAHRHLLQIYDQEKEWESAILVAGRLGELGVRSIAPVIAQYHCEIAETAIREGRYDNAEDHAARARTIDPGCVRAIIQSGRLSALHGNHAEAIEKFRQVEQCNPAYLGEVLDLIATSYRTMGSVAEYRRFLESAVERHNDIRLMFALVEVVDELEGSLRAEEFLVRWLRKRPTIFGLYRLIELKLKQRPRDKADLELLEGMIGSPGQEGFRLCMPAVRLHRQVPPLAVSGLQELEQHLVGAEPQPELQLPGHRAQDHQGAVGRPGRPG
ncbi:MAG: lipopolysaccharide assembly protein LapB [Gammaproteobacteria bacterium]|nr:lipopolysaccharide assembly protein LapB [Gammaproteobacteria bacterium]